MDRVPPASEMYGIDYVHAKCMKLIKTVKTVRLFGLNKTVGKKANSEKLPHSDHFITGGTSKLFESLKKKLP